jgi:hypothetical protein
MSGDEFKDVKNWDDKSVHANHDNILHQLNSNDPKIWTDIKGLDKDQFDKTNTLLEKEFGKCLVLDEKNPNHFQVQDFKGQSTVKDPVELAALSSGMTVGNAALTSASVTVSGADKAALIAAGAYMAKEWVTGGQTSEQRAEAQHSADGVNGELSGKSVVTDADLSAAQANVASIVGNTPEASFARARATAALQQVEQKLAASKLAQANGLDPNLAQKYNSPEQLQAAMEKWKQDHPDGQAFQV